jgi:L-threonylcarbamoyladenylate synthase
VERLRYTPCVIRAFDEAALEAAVERLRDGELVAFPTETVYGLGARADRGEAVRRIYEAKGRPRENPSIVHLHDGRRALELAAEVPATAEALARAFWPGPLTLVLRAREGVLAPETLAFGATVALRVPRHPVALALLEAVASPVAAPSANRSTAISPTTAQHVEKSLGPSTFILDGGPTGFGIESTIVELPDRHTIRVLRRGSIGVVDLEPFGRVVDGGDELTREGERMVAPGRSRRHYAPRVRTRFLEPGERPSEKVGVLLVGDALTFAEARCERLPSDPIEYARGLYACLHALEDSGVEEIALQPLPDSAEWAAVRDRLVRATG